MGQQQLFQRFRQQFNHERPHEALGDRPPPSRWQPSPRPYSRRLPEPACPGHYQVRRVSNAGMFRLKARAVFLSQALRGDDIGPDEIDDGIWSVSFYDVLLARLDERSFTLSA